MRYTEIIVEKKKRKKSKKSKKSKKIRYGYPFGGYDNHSDGMDAGDGGGGE